MKSLWPLLNFYINVPHFTWMISSRGIKTSTKFTALYVNYVTSFCGYSRRRGGHWDTDEDPETEGN